VSHAKLTRSQPQVSVTRKAHTLTAATDASLCGANADGVIAAHPLSCSWWLTRPLWHGALLLLSLRRRQIAQFARCHSQSLHC
jgi:hypothetical protein